MIKITKGDITKSEVDAIVNAANSSLKGGGGVDGAIHSAGGPTIMKECKKIVEEIGKLDTGKSVKTTAGDLPAQYVIHTVGPVYKDGSANESELLASSYFNSLNLGKELNCKSIAFPNISTGVYGFPKSEAAKIAFNSCREWLTDNNYEMDIFLVCYDEENYKILKELEAEK